MANRGHGGDDGLRKAGAAVTCPHCGSTVAAAAPDCPRCHRAIDDALTIVRGGVDAPTFFTPPPGDAPTVFDAPTPPPSNTEFDLGADGVTRLASDDDAMTIAATPQAKSHGGASGDTGPLDVGQSFGPRYHIIRLLGIGGMGAVYQAWDSELGVAVALKVIRPEVMADKVAAAEVERRFKRELLLARQVTHRNVVRIHDLGAIGGIKYITMSYVDGTDLATRLKREGSQTVPTVVRMARSVASGLVAAHSAGVVHRDLKPANIMIDREGEALIMDFGIALSTGEAARAGAESAPEHLQHTAAAQYAVTTVGSIVGTVEYMAPEQAKGQPVDQRADIYAFGLILYDALVGRRRHEHAASAIEDLQKRMVEPPAPVKSAAPNVPDALSTVISRCLEPDPAKRFQTSADVVTELNRLDDQGKLIPIARRLTKRMMVAAALLVIGLLAGTFYLTRRAVAPVAAHEPVSVVIADLDNRTKDPAFERTLEPMLRRALQDASFISAYDHSSIGSSLGVPAPEQFGETAARELAANQGLGVVLAGFVEPQGNGYRLGLKALQTVTGETIADEDARAASKEQVLEAATRLVARIRRALGDETSESAQMFAMRSVSATSLEVVRYYAAAVEAQMNGKVDLAQENFLKAVKEDPEFGFGYLGLAAFSRNRGRQQEAVNYTNEALRYLEGMTERERFNTRAFYYRITGDYPQCVKAYGELTARYSADTLAHNQRALCFSKIRDMQSAVDEMQQAVRTLPKRVLFRGNLAVYSAYGGQFEQAEKEALSVAEPYDLATLSVAFAKLGQGQLADAAATYQKLSEMTVRGKSWATSGLGDLALYEGRFSEAVRILQEGAAADLAAKTPDRAARKLTSVAYAHLAQGQTAAAVNAAQAALGHSTIVEVQLLAARIFVEAGEITRAKELASQLAKGLFAEARAYAKIIEGEIALKTGDAQQAIAALTEANGILDTWLGRFDLGRAYLAAGLFVQADSEFDACIKRRGEALSLFLDEEPTSGYFPAVHYYQGRTREAMKTARFTESYQQYLTIRGNSKEDPIVRELRRSVN